MSIKVRAALFTAAEQFRVYGENHLRKEPPQLDKAEVNLNLAEKCLLALADPNDDPMVLTRSLAAYAVNLAHGEALADFEMVHLVGLAEQIGVRVSEKNARTLAARRVVREIMGERKKQIDIFGYTADRDDANPDKMYHEVLTRVEQRPNNVEARQALIEAAAIIVAEIESLDRRFPPVPIAARTVSAETGIFETDPATGAKPLGTE